MTPSRSQRKKTPYIEDHFSLWEDAHFRLMAEEREIDDLLDRLFPTDRQS